MSRGIWRRVSPQCIDASIYRDVLVIVGSEKSHECLLLATDEVDLPVVINGVDRSKKSNPH